MKILVAYASKHGATQGIAERIAGTLRQMGQDAETHPIGAVGDLASYDAYVIGSAVYMGSWLSAATALVRQNQAILASRPVWLFSSGPLGTKAQDAQGRDLLVVSAPKEFAEFTEAIKPRALQVFFGALDPARLSFSERLLRRFPAGRALLPEGDFRNWSAIEAWAGEIARTLAPATSPTT